MMNAYRNLNDNELLVLIYKKDNQAMEEVYLRYWGGLFHHASRLLRNEVAAEDLVHDLFANLIDNMGSLHITGALDSYLYRAVRNRVINEFQREKNRQKHIDSIKDFIKKGQFVTDEMILEREMKRRIEAAVATFPPKMREAFELSRTGNLSRREIAEIMHTEEGTVKTQMTRALKILRTKLTIWFF